MATPAGPQGRSVRSPTRPKRTRATGTSLFVALLSAVTAGAAGTPEEPKVEIAGGADGSGQNYRWTVTNHYGSPIVYIQFPHYHADTFHAPEGWSKESTYLVNVGVPDKPGTCTASVDSARKGIPPGRSAEFSVRLATGGAHRRPGQVTVRFADGTQTIVAGVELPTASTTPERLYGLIGFALVFVIIVIVQTRRRRKGPRAIEPDAGSAVDDE